LGNYSKGDLYNEIRRSFLNISQHLALSALGQTSAKLERTLPNECVYGGGLIKSITISTARCVEVPEENWKIQYHTRERAKQKEESNNERQ
jgi:hypothetical protein